MSLADKLACAFDRRDEAPNIELAETLAAQDDIGTDVLELLGILKNGKKDQRHDAIKVLYELAARRPHDLAGKLDLILDFLPQKDNRLSWGVLTLLTEISKVHPGQIEPHLELILSAADQGSVIAKDRAMDILINLVANSDNQAEINGHMLAAMDRAAINQLPMYAENAAPILEGEFAKQVATLLQRRVAEAPTDAKKRRLEKTIKQLATK